MLHELLALVGKIRNRKKLQILIYHQVLEKFDAMRPSEPDVRQFDRQMRIVASHFSPLSLDDALAHIAADTLPDNAICVTFDDGYKNNLYLAQPILEKYGIPATYYISTGFSFGQNMWNDSILQLFGDPERTHLKKGEALLELGDWSTRREMAKQTLLEFKRLPIQERLDAVSTLYKQNGALEISPMMMTPDEVITLSRRPGATIGAHTVNHPILMILSRAEQYQEILQSKQVLEQWIGKSVEHFAYPNGVWNLDADETTESIVKEIGFKSAVITNWGKVTAATSLYRLPRFTGWDKKPLKWHARLIIK